MGSITKKKCLQYKCVAFISFLFPLLWLILPKSWRSSFTIVARREWWENNSLKASFHYWSVWSKAGNMNVNNSENLDEMMWIFSDMVELRAAATRKNNFPLVLIVKIWNSMFEVPGILQWTNIVTTTCLKSPHTDVQRRCRLVMISSRKQLLEEKKDFYGC